MSALPTQIHMIGVGGMGMAPLALYLKQTGIRVSGEDDAMNPRVRSLLEAGRIEIVDTKTATRMRKKAPMIAFSSALSEQDARLVEAREAGVDVVRRGELLARLCHKRQLLAVVGSHGKTTTAAMLVTVLRQAGFVCDYVLGGLCRGETLPPSLFMGASWVIAEVDESDGTIEHFSPEITLAVNYDWDHPDRYANDEALAKTFGDLFARTRSRVIVAKDSPVLMRLAEASCKPMSTFGGQGDYVFKILEKNLESQTLRLEGAFDPIEMQLPAGGAYNAHNAVAALAAVHQLAGSLPPDPLAIFPGVLRRQDKLYDCEDLCVYADYAHHPTEIAALLKHYREAGSFPMAVVFQPHRYSRTRRYAEAFAHALKSAEHLILLPVYAASEAEDAEGKTDAILRYLEGHASCRSLEDVSLLPDALCECKEKVNTILFVGAGDIEAHAQEFIESLCPSADWFAALGAGVGSESVLSRHEPLGKRTTIRLGGHARWYAEPASVEDLQTVLRAAHAADVRVFFLGRGSNLIVHDSGFDGLVVHLHHPFWRKINALDAYRMEVGAGLRLQALSAKACKQGMAGFEFLEGIPGSVGGALRMNAGAMGGWMFDVVEEVEYITLEGELRRAVKAEFTVGYRHCEELKRGIATRAVLRAPECEEVEAIRERMQRFAEQRVGSQPREPSAGCIFKNPEGDHAGKIIDELGLKGTRIGNAEISTVHGNFIINRGGATTADVISLVRHVREEARKHRGVELTPEVMLVGKRWEDVL